MAHETAGDPVSGLKWTRRTTAKLADELRGLGIHVCPQTVARLLKAMGYSLRVNHKKLAGASNPNRDQQFRHITALRERCAADHSPLISVDTKKKELVGRFRNPGAKWDRSPELVNDHDFRSDADGLAVPYGIYDPRANAGTVFVGRTADTPAFAVDCIEKWWRTEGRKRYPEAKTLQILADGGGSNSCTARAWKFNLQHRLCNRHGLRVRVAHYPPATSKWNPIEHRLFCEISKNWAGRPLDSFETILKYLRTTRTSTGLRVRAHLVRRTYKTGVKVTDAQMRELRMGRPQSSWTRIKGESDVTRRWGYGSVEAGEGSWVGADGGSPEGDRSRRRRGGDGVGGLGAGTTVEREPETGCGVAAAA